MAAMMRGGCHTQRGWPADEGRERRRRRRYDRDDGSMQGSTPSNRPPTAPGCARRTGPSTTAPPSSTCSTPASSPTSASSPTDGPIVLPMAYGRTDEWLYVHGSVANAAARGGRPGHLRHRDDRRRDRRRTLPVPQLDELPRRRRARTARAGRATPTSTWPPCDSSATTSWRRGTRPGTDAARSAQTMVVAVPLVEMSAKIRTATRSTSRPTSTVRTGPGTCRSAPSGGAGWAGPRPRHRVPAAIAAWRAPRVTRRNRVDPWGDLHAAGGRRRCSPATAAASSTTPAASCAITAARRCGSRA